MADIIAVQTDGVPRTMSTRYRDMLDGTHAQVVALSAGAGGQVDISDRIGRLLGRTANYDVLSDGTLAALNETVEIDASGLSTIGVSITGVWVGTIAIQGNVGDGVWHFLPMVDALTGTAIVSATANGVWQIGVGGFLRVRVLMFLYTSGTATVFIEGTSATAGVFLSKSLPFGINAIGSLQATEAHIGNVGGHCYTVSANPVLTVAGAYIANDFVGTSATAMTFTNAVRVAGGSGVIESAVLIDKALQSVSTELWLFDTAPTPPADNAPWTISDADALTCIGVIPFGTYYASALNSVCFVKGLGMVFNATVRDIYGCFVTRGAPTYASLDLMVRLQILGD